MYFDRFDICAAYNMYSVLWGGDGYHYQNYIRVRLNALKYRPAHSEEYLEGLNENARDIYNALVLRREGVDESGE